MNFYKPDSQYNEGMKPLIYSRKMASEKNIGWMREGEKICYYQSNFK